LGDTGEKQTLDYFNGYWSLLKRTYSSHLIDDDGYDDDDDDDEDDDYDDYDYYYDDNNALVTVTIVIYICSHMKQRKEADNECIQRSGDIHIYLTRDLMKANGQIHFPAAYTRLKIFY